jgi:glutaredoxin
MNTIKLYGSPYCQKCLNLKKYLTEKNISFDYIDVIEDTEAQEYIILKTKQMNIPILELNNEEYIIGYDLEKINKSLNL